MTSAHPIAITARAWVGARFHQIWPAAVILVGLSVTVVWNLMVGYAPLRLVGRFYDVRAYSKLAWKIHHSS
jgi:hypothetical protein